MSLYASVVFVSLAETLGLCGIKGSHRHIYIRLHVVFCNYRGVHTHHVIVIEEYDSPDRCLPGRGQLIS